MYRFQPGTKFVQGRLLHIMDVAYKIATARFSSRPGVYKGCSDRKMEVFPDTFLVKSGPIRTGNAVENRTHGSPPSPKIRQHYTEKPHLEMLWVIFIFA